MALILCLETSSKNCSVSISRNGSTLFFKDYFDENYCHGEKLHVLIQNILIEHNFSISNFDAFAYSSGPGSYTGLRIGAASVKGFAFALRKPVIAVSTMQSLVSKTISNNSNFYNNEDLFCPVLDSRQGEVYAALYNCDYKEYLKPFSCSID
ncbi:MAG: tRNA (adenosine(37)-N6)-threonylcarbamoyltransferase complex dimerization subunit type 1 TsaB [Flavobacteriales bacterium]|nr:tRNA (adenosine(37)-N6)-threonylcarbamoyltransferase complex dimerization subunit type 1 TsaB [Flavobacteriales bacterium]